MASLTKLSAIAKEKGLKNFIADNPCKHGHYLRHTASLSCVDCGRTEEARRKNREHSREYRAQHPEKVSFWVTRWQKNHPEEMNAIYLRFKEKRANAKANRQRYESC